MEYLKITIKAFLIMLLITVPWQLYEKIMYGEVKPDTFDSLVALVLTGVILFCIEQQKEKRQVYADTITTLRKARKAIEQKDEQIRQLKEELNK